MEVIFENEKKFGFHASSQRAMQLYRQHFALQLAT